jgi:hypothetical protein
MSASTSTSTPPQPAHAIDPAHAHAVINNARQLPLHAAALKHAFPEATQDIARIAENANPDDPLLLKDEVGAIKVRARAVHPSPSACRLFCAGREATRSARLGRDG